MLIPKLPIHYFKLIWPILFILVQGCSGYKTGLIVPDILSKQAKIDDLTTDERLNLLTNTLSFNEQIKSYSREQLDIERQHQIEVAGSEDFAKGVTAFFEKRKPNYKNK